MPTPQNFLGRSPGPKVMICRDEAFGEQLDLNEVMRWGPLDEMSGFVRRGGEKDDSVLESGNVARR